MRGKSIRHGVLIAIGLAAVGVACGFPNGPTIDVQVESPRLVPTTGNSQLCCCHVTGFVLNRSTIVVHATVEFDGFAAGDPPDKPSFTFRDFLSSLQPNERRAFTATGVLQGCAAVREFRLVQPMDVKGVWSPP